MNKRQIKKHEIIKRIAELERRADRFHRAWLRQIDINERLINVTDKLERAIMCQQQRESYSQAMQSQHSAAMGQSMQMALNQPMSQFVMPKMSQSEIDSIVEILGVSINEIQELKETDK